MTIIVREYARLTTANVASTLDMAKVTETAFEWLCSLNAQFRKSGALLLQVQDQQWLRLDNYVGVIETPCGTRLEILPKHMHSADDAARSRKLLCKMLRVVHKLPVRAVGAADIELFDQPLTEWVMRQFLLALEHLLVRGIRSDYSRVEEEQRYLRGQSDAVRQMRQPLGKQHFFQIRHDVFSADRAENRLIKKALEIVAKSTEDATNWRLARELSGALNEIPASCAPLMDFGKWASDRSMAHYRDIKRWCELIFGQQMPLTQKGAWHGISMLFPMEKLFEKYVASCLGAKLPADRRIRTGAREKDLCTHLGRGFFELKPDILIESTLYPAIVVDAKWKRLSDAQDSKYGISQSDFYQLFAYGHKYLNGEGALVLIYPCREGFSAALAPFHFSDKLTMWIIPFDLDEDRLLDAHGALHFLIDSNNPSVQSDMINRRLC